MNADSAYGAVPTPLVVLSGSPATSVPGNVARSRFIKKGFFPSDVDSTPMYMNQKDLVQEARSQVWK